MLKPRSFSKYINSSAILFFLLISFKFLSDPYNKYEGETNLGFFILLLVWCVCLIVIAVNALLYLINIKRLEKIDKIFFAINISLVALLVLFLVIFRNQTPAYYFDFLCGNKQCLWENGLRKGTALETCNLEKTNLNKESCYVYIVGEFWDPLENNKYFKDIQPCYEYLKVETSQDKSWFNDCVETMAYRSKNKSFCDYIDKNLNNPGLEYTKSGCIKGMDNKY